MGARRPVWDVRLMRGRATRSGRFLMTAVQGLEAKLEEMERELLGDESLPPKVLAYLHLQASVRFLKADAGQPAKTPEHDRPVQERPRSGGLVVARHYPAIGHSFSRGTGKVQRKIDPDRLKVIEHAANAIRGREEPTKTSEIFEELAPEVRALIRGEEPKSNLSAMLFHSPIFRSHGRSGWTLDEAPEWPSPVLDSGEMVGLSDTH